MMYLPPLSLLLTLHLYGPEEEIDTRTELPSHPSGETLWAAGGDGDRL